MIANTAIGCAVHYTSQVVYEDADIFQLLLNKIRPKSKPFNMVTEKQNDNHLCLDINAIRDKIGEEYAQFLPVLHEISGCNTTSKLYSIGKIKILKKHKKYC